MSEYKRLSELQESAFKKNLPNETRRLENVACLIHGVIQEPLKNGQDADLRRFRKRLMEEARTLSDLSMSEKRDLKPTEETYFGALTQTMDNIDFILESSEMCAESERTLPPLGGSSGFRKNEQKIIFRCNEKIGESRGVPPELKGLSIGRMMNIMVNGAEKARATEKEQRSLQEGTNSAGGYTVPSLLLSTFIDKMRAKSVCQQAGASTVLLDSNKVSIARLATDPVAAWRAELGNVATSDPTFEQVQFVAKSLAVTVRVSRELLADSINVEAALEDALARSLALEVDRVCLFGTGVDPQPKGITLAAGIQTVSVGGANGGQLTNYAPVLQGLQKLSEANADATTAIVMAPRTKYALAGLLDTTNQPLNAPAIVAKVPQLDTIAVPVNMTKGTANNATKIIMGDFSQMMLGVRQELEIEISREKFIDTLEVAFVAHLRFDVQFAHNEAFCVIDGIIP